MKKENDILKHFPWYDYSKEEPELNEELLEQALIETGSTDMNTALWNKSDNLEYGNLYTTVVQNKGEMAFLNYAPAKNYAWVTYIDDDDEILEFHANNWEDIEKLRYQLNFNS